MRASIFFRSSARAALLATLALAAATAPAAAQADPAVDTIFAAWDRADSPGCALGVSRAGELVYTAGYGMANLDYAIPNGPEMVYYAGSVSKQFTAGAIALLAEEGALDPDADIRTWFPELPVYERPITVRHLVHHTSGLRDIYTLMALAGIRLEDVFPDADALALIARQEGLNFPPGSDYLYSNSGYFLLAQLVRRVTGSSLREFTTERILAPLGMADTHFHDDPGHVLPNRVMSYQRAGDGFRISYLANFDKVGAGGLYTTIPDLARWDAQFYQPAVGGAGWLARVHTPGVLTGGDTLGYAWGLNLGSYRDLPIVEHSGSMMGFKAHLLRFPEERLSVLLLCNLGEINPGSLARQVAQVYLGERMAPVARPAARGGAAGSGSAAAPPPPAFDPDDYVGTYGSRELDATWTLVREGAELVLQRPLGITARLRPRETDRFVAGSYVLTFERNAAGAVTGFRVAAGRVTDIGFERR
ncbi:MAG: serine hydrolase domain-containing protein [Gemmatimonadota bacterium]